jgi:hypothetical protein
LLLSGGRRVFRGNPNSKKAKFEERTHWKKSSVVAILSSGTSKVKFKMIFRFIYAGKRRERG